MIRKLQFPVYILILMLSFFLQSCEKKSQDSIMKQHNTIEIDKLLNLADKYFEKSEYDSSYYYFNKAKSACDTTTDVSKIIYSISNLATIQQNLGDYSGSETTAMEAMPILQRTSNPKYKWNIYTILGINYLNTNNAKYALFYFNKALNLKTDESRKIGSNNNIALVYIENEDYYKAIKILSTLKLNEEVKNDWETYSDIINNLGYCYSKIGSTKAIVYLNKSLNINLKKKNDWGLISSYYNLASFHTKNNLALSNNYAKIAYKKATKLKSVDSRLGCLKLLIQNTSGDELKKHSLTYLHINDSITKVRQKAKNQFAKIKYDFKREKEENIKLKSQKKLQLEQQENRNQILYFGLFLFIILIVSIANYLVAKNKREKIKASYNTETRISKKLHDELANDVYQTMAFAETQDLSTTQNKEILISSLDTIYIRTRNISRENSNIDTGLAFISHLKDMMSGFNTSMVNVLINGVDTIKWTELENHKKIIVYRVVQELLVNMKKHSKCSLVVLTFKKNENKLQIDYTDNGVGIGNSELISKNGLLNVENRIHAIKGTITFDTKSNKGFRVSLDFPI